MRKLAILILLLATICAFGQLDSLNMRLERVFNACSYPLYQVNDSIYITRSSTVTFDTLFHSKETISSSSSTLASVYNDSIAIYRDTDSLENLLYTFINVSNGTFEDTLNRLSFENNSSLSLSFYDSLMFWKWSTDTLFYANLNELPRINVRDTVLGSTYLFDAIRSCESKANDTICFFTGSFGMAYNMRDIFYPVELSRFPYSIEYGYGYWSDEKAFASDSVIFCGGSDYINRYIISFETGEIRPYDVGEEYYDGGNYTCGALRCWYDDSIVVSIPYRLDADGEYYSNRISLLNIKDPFDVKTVASYTVDIEGDVYYSDCLVIPDDSLIVFIVRADLERKYCFLRLCSTEGVNENQGKGPESYSIHTFPNPFNSSCEIELEYSDTDNIKVDILDVNGKIIEELYNGKGFTGSLKWNPKDIESGVYFLNVKSSEENTSTSTKLVYLK